MLGTTGGTVLCLAVFNLYVDDLREETILFFDVFKQVVPLQVPFTCPCNTVDRHQIGKSSSLTFHKTLGWRVVRSGEHFRHMRQLHRFARQIWNELVSIVR